MRDVAGSTPGLDLYLLCEPICASLRLLYYIFINLLKNEKIYISTFPRGSSHKHLGQHRPLSDKGPS
jgi:hypothetical protein